MNRNLAKKSRDISMTNNKQEKEKIRRLEH